MHAVRCVCAALQALPGHVRLPQVRLPVLPGLRRLVCAHLLWSVHVAGVVLWSVHVAGVVLVRLLPRVGGVPAVLPGVRRKHGALHGGRGAVSRRRHAHLRQLLRRVRRVLPRMPVRDATWRGS